MNRIYCIAILSCLVAAGFSFAMEGLEEDSKARRLELSLLSTVNDGKFLDDKKMILSGFGGAILYDTEAQKEEKIFGKVVDKITKSRGDTVVAYDVSQCILYDLITKKCFEIERSPAHRSVAFNSAGTHLFMYNTGHFMEVTGGHMTGEHVYNGQKLISVDCNTHEQRSYQVERDEDTSEVGAMACHPLRDEIAYASGKNVVSIISLENGSVQKKSSITVGDIVGYVSGMLKYSLDGSHLGIQICGATKGSGLSLCMYDFETKELSDFGQCYGIDFHPNGLIMALLRRNTAVDFIDFRTKEVIALIEPIDHDHLFENCGESITISPDGKCLFVSIPIGRPGMNSKNKGFLINIPAVVYAYNKAKAEQR